MAAIGISALSLLFTVLGNVDLGLLLQTTVVRGAVLAAAEYAAVLVLDEIAHLIVHSLKARGIRSVTTFEYTIMSAARRIAVIGAVVLWLIYMLNSLRILGPVSDAINALLAAHWTIGQVTISLGRTLGFAISVWIAIFASRITQVLLRDDVLPRFALPRGVPNAISTVANYAMVLIGLLIGAGILGIELSNLTLIVGALGVGIGFGLQNVVNNLVSGFILIFERSVQIGDTVQVSDLTGNVTQIGLRASRLRTVNGSEVIVPNGELISNRLINWTLSDRRRRLEAAVGVAYGSDLEKVHSILRGVFDAEAEVMRDPEPLVVFEKFGDSTLNFRMYFWIQDLDVGLKVVDRVNTAIAHALAAGRHRDPVPANATCTSELCRVERPLRQKKARFLGGLSSSCLDPRDLLPAIRPTKMEEIKRLAGLIQETDKSLPKTPRRRRFRAIWPPVCSFGNPVRLSIPFGFA